MNVRVSDEFGSCFARIPLKAAPHIVHGNALNLRWDDVLVPERCSCVLGNPPFVGAKFMSDAQRADAAPVFAPLASGGLLDFVPAWYVKAADYMRASTAAAPRCAFVSTNSITQGEQVGVLWGWLLQQRVHIHFAHRTFRWSNEARGVAAVHCVIVGFGLDDVPDKRIFEYDDIRGDAHAVAARNINPYLVDAADVVLPRRSQPICDVPGIDFGSMPNDGGHLLLTEDEAGVLLAIEPSAKPYLFKFVGALEFINSVSRWCIWLRDATPEAIRRMPAVLERIERVRRYRLASERGATRRLADRAAMFGEDRQPTTAYILLPRHSSERRAFIPIGFMEPNVVCGDANMLIANASVYDFGVLTSTMHNAWVRSTCGRLKSDFRYSKHIV